MACYLVKYHPYKTNCITVGLGNLSSAFKKEDVLITVFELYNNHFQSNDAAAAAADDDDDNNNNNNNNNESGSSAGIVISVTARRPGIYSRKRQKILSSPSRPERI